MHRSIRSSAVALLALPFLACNGCQDGNAPPPNAAASASVAPPASTPSAALDPAADASSASPPSGAETAVHIEDDGKSFDLAQGATLTVALPSNAGTGYIWLPTQVDPNVLAKRGERTSAVSSDVPGAPKLDIYHFTAATAGKTVLEMSLKRPFGSGVPTRTVHVTVTVH